ncbi:MULTISPECIES: hypothetical protein [Streptomyces]|uniref:Uncharacterized protein n=1 Tax=Streptomyces odorifer TaxID=53450 RepID=A0A7Y6CB55_9ACTN|nr:hypothetical protein [Streptomyces odorifer]NUV30336.1 hypothetical protein [Streptomyces odorifer]NUV36501.1 hypothetical protein [Streptomyces sp. KAI-27]NUV47733.1 hypothetical protein [Streptomyces sp. CAI-78]
MTEERARRRARLASGERSVLVEPAADALTLYAVFTGVPFAVAAYCLTVQRAELGAVGLTFLLIGFAAGVPLALRVGERRRAAALITEIRAAHPLGPDCHPVRTGLNEPGRSPGHLWDTTPPRDAVVSVQDDTLQLRAESGESLDIPFTDILGVLLLPAGRGRAAADLHLHSGEAIELRTTRIRPLGVTLSEAGVRVLFEDVHV